jgi:hypothetical protein
MWGPQPWDNDLAADWFRGLMKDTKLPFHVRKVLKLSNTKEVDPEITPMLRAAAFCVLQLGHVYVWPVDDLEDDLKLARQSLQVVLNDEDYCYSEEVTSKINKELSELEIRLKKLSS